MSCIGDRARGFFGEEDRDRSETVSRVRVWPAGSSKYRLTSDVGDKCFCDRFNGGGDAARVECGVPELLDGRREGPGSMPLSTGRERWSSNDRRRGVPLAD